MFRAIRKTFSYATGLHHFFSNNSTNIKCNQVVKDDLSESMHAVIVQAPEPVPEPIVESVPVPEPEPIVESVPVPEPESIVESVPVPVPESIVESVPEPIVESVPEPATEPVPEPIAVTYIPNPNYKANPYILYTDASAAPVPEIKIKRKRNKHK
jgi:fused signal recognition particle receptor